MHYEIDKFYDFPIVGGTSADDKFFILQATSADGTLGEVTLPKISFQRDPKRPVPTSLTCRVKSFGPDGLPVLAHALSSYVYELHHGSFERGESIETEVIGIPANPAEEPFTVRDRFGILYRLFDKEGLMTKGQVIHCKFTKMATHFFEIERVDEAAGIPYYPPADLFDALQMNVLQKKFVKLSLISLPEMAGVRREIKAKNPLWTLTGAKAIIRLLPHWFLRSKNDLKRKNNAFTALLSCFRDACLYLIEGSGFLNAVAPENRRALQQQFTEIIDSLEPYYTILRLIRDEEQANFVERLLDKLQRSGYLYHPARQFAVLMLIFRMDPDKVAKYLSRIFESIFSRDLENWKREPFRSAFVEQFEMYVHQERNEIDALPLAESREQKQRLETIITAIALQLILADKEAGYERSASLFFRYISLMRPESNEKLLAKSFLSLLGVHVPMRLDYKQLKQPMMVMTAATVMPEGDFMQRIGTTHRFVGDLADIEISADGISLGRNGRRDISNRLIPADSMPWLKPQLRLSDLRAMPKSRKIEEHKRWWRDAEASLFSETTAPVARTTQRRNPEPGDDVYITVNGVIDPDSNIPTFKCAVHDEEFVECAGTLRLDSIVGYNLRYPNMLSFKDSRGNDLGFFAHVEGLNPDGTLRFSLTGEIEAYRDETLNFNDEYLAVVASSKNAYYNTQLGIAELGFGVALQLDDKEAYPKGTHVYFKMCESDNKLSPTPGCEFRIVRVTENPEDKFDKTTAFYKLIQSIGIEAENDQQQTGSESASENLLLDSDELLSPDDIREIIGIIRFRALAQSDIIAAYDYLSYAALLARAIGDSQLHDRLEIHAELLNMHQFYATNSTIDTTTLEKLRPEAMDDPILSKIFHRLEMVSWLGDQSHNNDLFDAANNPGSELEGTVAKMVLASNLMDNNDGEEKPVVPRIKQLLMSRLNMSVETKRGKYYGSESKFLEFKTSLVFPAVTRGEQMKTDPLAQQTHILSRIAGMLNADGGRLYLGVNDHGYEVGMHDDFEYYRRQTVSDGRGYHKISSLPDLCKFLELLINNRFGKTVARKITVTIDEEAPKGVVQISIDESLEPVFLDNRLYVRQSGEVTQEYHGKDIDDFIHEREQLRIERAQIQALNARLLGMDIQAEPVQADEAPATQESAPAPEQAPQPAEPQPEPDNQEASRHTIATSAWRPNVLHEYEDGYQESVGYIYFTGDSMTFSTIDKYEDLNNPDCRLALAIPHNLSDGCLVLGFNGEKAQRIPLAEIYEKGENVKIPYWQDDELMFATVARKDDIINCVFADSGNALWVRSVRLAQIESNHLTSTPRKIHDANMDHTFAWEIAGADADTRLADSMADNLGARRYGYPLRVKEGTPNVEFKINEIFSKCAPAL